MMNQDINVIGGEVIRFFYSIPDDILIEMASKDWESLKNMCIMLTLDTQIVEEQNQKFIN